MTNPNFESGISRSLRFSGRTTESHRFGLNGPCFQIAKKQARKEEKERKDAEERERKKEREKLLQEEMAQLKGKEPSKPSQKVTRAQIEKTLLAASSAASAPKDNKVVEQNLVLENLNRVSSEKT